MKRAVVLSIRGRQTYGKQEPEIIELVTEGTMEFANGGWDISYEESDLIGMEGVTSAFEVDGDRVALERTGKLQSRMEFVEGQKTESLYSMDFGAMLLGVTARRVESHMTDEGGSIHLEYGVELERNFLGLNTYDIQVKTVEERT